MHVRVCACVCVCICVYMSMCVLGCVYCYMDSLPLPYFKQTAYPDNRNSPDCMLYCVGRLVIVPPNSLRCDCVFAHAHLCHSYFILECPKHWNIRGVLSLPVTICMCACVCVHGCVFVCVLVCVQKLCMGVYVCVLVCVTFACSPFRWDPIQQRRLCNYIVYVLPPVRCDTLRNEALETEPHRTLKQNRPSLLLLQLCIHQAPGT